MFPQEISNAHWGYEGSLEKGRLNLVPDDLDSTSRVYKKYNILPESLKMVCTDFLIQKHYLIRYIIKELDLMLTINGVFQITLVDSKSHGSYFLSRDQVKYEFAVATNGRYKLNSAEKKGEYLVLSYSKTFPTLPLEDSIKRWSFGAITNGKKLESVNALITSIHNLKIPEYEIIICGPYPQDQPISYKNIKILSDVILKDDIRFPIPAKKNKIIKEARYNNLCIAHDRFTFPANWFDKMAEYGNYFDYLCLPTVDKDGNRFAVDWMKFCYPIASRLKKNNSLSYGQWNPDVIIQGGIIVGKKHIMRRYYIDERLHWEELEDIHFSKQAYLDGSFLYIDPQNKVISEAINHVPQTKFSVKQKIKHIIVEELIEFISKYKFNKAVKSFYHNKNA